MKYFLLALISGLINFHNSDLRLHKNSFISTAPTKDVKSIGSEYFPIDLKKKLIYNSSFGDLELKVVTNLINLNTNRSFLSTIMVCLLSKHIKRLNFCCSLPKKAIISMINHC